VSLVEHVLASLAGLHIDNCRVELDAPEPPGLDGSALRFVQALIRAGVELQSAWRPVWGVDRPVTVSHRDATLTLHPAEDYDPGLRISYILEYDAFTYPGRQSHTERLTPGSFIENLAACRTFVLEEEVEMLRRQGIGLRTTPADLLVFGPRGPIDNTLRHANEPARHKVLDIVGDLALLGVDLCGHVVAYRSGHPLNIDLARTLCRSAAETVGRERQVA
jgi:UDP-3-O-acyl-N-acetylglucosamine deacetylase